MARYIDADALKTKAFGKRGGLIHTSDIDEAPTADVVEVVRCKECRYYEWMSNRVPNEQTWFCHNWNTETGKDDFCSYAERRKE